MKISLNVALDSCDPDLTLGIMRSFLDALSDVTVIGTAAHKKCSRKEPLNIQLALCRPPEADSLPESSLWHEVIPCIALTDKNLTAVQSQIEEGQPRPLFWTVQQGRGRVFVSIPGHYMWTFDDPMFRTVVLRGIAWVGHRNVDRFNSLVTLDARIE